ncbi:hypothetical protein AKO1_004418, partial [Acrasis kona]
MMFGLPINSSQQVIFSWIQTTLVKLTPLIHNLLSTWQTMPSNTNRVEINFLRCILESIAIFYLSEKSNKILFFGMLLVGGTIQCTNGLSEVHTCLLGPLAFAYHLLTGDAETEYKLADLGVELTKRYPSERFQCIANYFFAFNCHTKKTQYQHYQVFEKCLGLSIRTGEHCWGSLTCGFGSTIAVDL